MRLRVWGASSHSHSGVRGGAPAEPKMHFMHISGQKEAIWNTLFGIFERRRGPQTSRARENSPFPPLDGPGQGDEHPAYYRPTLD